MSANYRPEDPKVRSAIFKVFGGKCFYSGREVGVDEMVVDHIVPRSKGGEDSVYNYALTTKDINSKKSALLDKDGVGPVLYLVKTVYAPKVLRLLNRKERKPAIRGEKKRVTIYIDSADWLMVRKAAIDRGVSAGEYLMDLHRANLGKNIKSALAEKFESHRPKVEKVISPPVADISELPEGVTTDSNQTKGYVAALKGRIESIQSRPVEDWRNNRPADPKLKDRIENVRSDLKKVVSKKKSKSESGCSECRSLYGHRPVCSQYRFAK